MKKSDLKILYLTRSYQQYQSANYQSEFIKYFKENFNVKIIIVPTNFKVSAFSDENNNKINDDIKTCEEKIKKIYRDYDLILFGHNWIGDAKFPGAIYPVGYEFIKDLNIRKIAIINKEFSRFKDKVNYFKVMRCDTLITHHSSIGSKFKKENIENDFKIIFIPFAVDPDVWLKDDFLNSYKKYDLFFSGVLLNPTWRPDDQKIRIDIEDFLFYKLFNIRIKSKE